MRWGEKQAYILTKKPHCRIVISPVKGTVFYKPLEQELSGSLDSCGLCRATTLAPPRARAAPWALQAADFGSKRWDEF